MAFSTIQGSGGAPDSFVGTSGVDSITLTNATGNFFLGAQEANDFIAFNKTALDAGVISGATLKGGAGDDTFEDIGVGLNNNNATLYSGVFFNGNGGDDSLFAANNLPNLVSSTLQGGQGDDTIWVGQFSISLVNGNRDDDTLQLTNLTNRSSIYGGHGDDVINARGGSTLTGNLIGLGDGDDTFTETTSSTSIGDGNTIQGGSGNDTIFIWNASNGDVVAEGGDGVDVITTGNGVDTLSGGAGSDLLNGQGDNDVLTGGGGADTFDYSQLDGANVGSNTDSGDLTYGGDDDLANGTVDLITDFATGTDALDMFTAGAGELTANNQAATYAAALAANNADAGTTVYEVAAVGAGNSWTAYLFINAAATGDAVGAIQLGATGTYATAAGAFAAIAEADII